MKLKDDNHDFCAISIILYQDFNFLKLEILLKNFNKANFNNYSRNKSSDLILEALIIRICAQKNNSKNENLVLNSRKIKNLLRTQSIRDS